MLSIEIFPILLRFLFGGSAVVASTLISKNFGGRLGGIFAAFPAVMAAAVIMAGHFGSSEQASDIALGASAGMLGCTICVLTASFCMEHLGKWGLSLGIALLVWFFSSYAASQLIPAFLENIKRKRQ
jgi:hypothetical protein